MYTTELNWSGTHWVVTLLHGKSAVATMTLDEWAELSANKEAFAAQRQADYCA